MYEGVYLSLEGLVACCLASLSRLSRAGPLTSCLSSLSRRARNLLSLSLQMYEGVQLIETVFLKVPHGHLRDDKRCGVRPRGGSERV